MNNTPVVNKNTKKRLWKMTQISGLAVSIPFEIAAGPFIGYFIGSYLMQKFGVHRYVMYVFIIMGFVASITNTAIIIKMMVAINKERNERVVNVKD